MTQGQPYPAPPQGAPPQGQPVYAQPVYGHAQQPGVVMQPQVMMVQPGVQQAVYVQAPVKPQQLREFSTSCFDCFDDMGICCMTTWCPCIQYGQNVDKLKGSGSFGPCCTYCCLFYWTGCVCCVAAPTRTELRNKYGLLEAPMDDCLMHMPCCSACALCQEGRELKRLGL